MTNSTRPEAIRAPRPLVKAFLNWMAMFAAMVLPPGLRKWVKNDWVWESTIATAMVSPSARPNPRTMALITPERP